MNELKAFLKAPSASGLFFLRVTKKFEFIKINTRKNKKKTPSTYLVKDSQAALESANPAVPQSFLPCLNTVKYPQLCSLFLKATPMFN